MIIVIYIAIVALSCVQSASVKLYNKNNGSSAVFNFLKTVAALVIFVLMALKGFELHIPTIYYSVGFSLFLSVSMYCGYKALCLGPMSITSLLVSLSLVIPSIYGIAFCDEEMTFVKVIGFVLLFTALVLFNIKKTEEDRKTSGKWLFYVAMTFLTNGGCSVIQKIHQQNYTGKYCNEFMMFAMFVAGIIFLIPLLKKNFFQRISLTKGKRYGVLAGFSNGAVNFLTLVLAGYENASVLFPTISAGTIIASFICGTVFFKEKVSKSKLAGLILGVIAVILLKI